MTTKTISTKNSERLFCTACERPKIMAEKVREFGDFLDRHFELAETLAKEIGKTGRRVTNVDFNQLRFDCGSAMSKLRQLMVEAPKHEKHFHTERGIRKFDSDEYWKARADLKKRFEAITIPAESYLSTLNDQLSRLAFGEAYSPPTVVWNENLKTFQESRAKNSEQKGEQKQMNQTVRVFTGGEWVRLPVQGDDLAERIKAFMERNPAINYMEAAVTVEKQLREHQEEKHFAEISQRTDSAGNKIPGTDDEGEIGDGETGRGAVQDAARDWGNKNGLDQDRRGVKIPERGQSPSTRQDRSPQEEEMVDVKGINVPRRIVEEFRGIPPKAGGLSLSKDGEWARLSDGSILPTDNAPETTEFMRRCDSDEALRTGQKPAHFNYGNEVPKVRGFSEDGTRYTDARGETFGVNNGTVEERELADVIGFQMQYPRALGLARGSRDDVARKAIQLLRAYGLKDVLKLSDAQAEFCVRVAAGTNEQFSRALRYARSKAFQSLEKCCAAALA